VLLWVDREAGHGQGKPLNLKLRDLVDQRAFLGWQLGVEGTLTRVEGRGQNLEVRGKREGTS
jgi:hypothetical protein